MTVLLQKGQGMQFVTEELQERQLRVGLGWDPASKRLSVIEAIFGDKYQFDCDVAVMMLENDHFLRKKDLIYFGNRISPCGSILHCGDNTTGNGVGDDEVIMISLGKIPTRIQRLLFVVNIYECVSRDHDFSRMKNAYIRIEDTKTGEELIRFLLDEDYTGMTTLLVAELSRNEQGWEFTATGKGTIDKSLAEFAARYQ